MWTNAKKIPAMAYALIYLDHINAFATPDTSFEMVVVKVRRHNGA